MKIHVFNCFLLGVDVDKDAVCIFGKCILVVGDVV